MSQGEPVAATAVESALLAIIGIANSASTKEKSNLYIGSVNFSVLRSVILVGYLWGGKPATVLAKLLLKRHVERIYHRITL